MQRIIAENIRLPVTAPTEEIFSEAARRLKKAGISDIFDIKLHKRSLDARRRGNPCFVCSVICMCDVSTKTAEHLGRYSLKLCPKKTLDFPEGSEIMRARPVVIGFGPAGMFSALILAEHGYRPIVLERGDALDDRVKKTESFFAGGALDPESNVQFGAGGAGTFSDGKLTCRIGDGATETVLEMLHSLGAPEDILYNAKPHIGTDILRTVVKNAHDRIVSLGGEIRYRTRAHGITDRTVTAGGEKMDYGALVIASGHSARDTYRELISSSFAVEPKPYSVGVRIEHLRSRIDEALYGEFAGILPSAEYSLSKRSGDRGVYSFCMCPGGVVTASSSEERTVVTNGMSFRRRDGENSNSALCVSVLPSDYGHSAEGAIEFQHRLEKKAFDLGGGDYAAPAQTVGDFLSRSSGSRPLSVKPTYRGGDVRMSDMRELLPGFASEMLELGLLDFGKKIKGFDAPDAILCGVESRTSSPVRILRGESRSALGHSDIYPCGEGAGYAGGIVSAALDGIRTARAVMARFARPAD